MNILLLEDDTHIAMGLEYALQQEGYAVTLCVSIAQAKAHVEQNPVDLALLDLELPDGSGYEVCRHIKAIGDIPVIFLTVHADESSVVMGLDIGADDYIAKPFRLKELVSRIHSVMRRYPRGQVLPARLDIGGLTVLRDVAKVYKSGEELSLTAMEYRLLLYLMNHEGQLLSRDQILEALWDSGGEFINDNTLSVYIRRLREKIELDPQAPELLTTVRGMGYRFGENI